MKIKNILFTIVIAFTVHTTVYAIELYTGLVMGAAIPIESDTKIKTDPNFLIQVDCFMFEFDPIFAFDEQQQHSLLPGLDIGFGVRMTSWELYVPIMGRIQYNYMHDELGEYGATGYFSAGVKLGVYLGDGDLYDEFVCAPAIAIGGEWKVQYSHYLGLRVGCDFNLLPDKLPYSMNIAFTYRTLLSEETLGNFLSALQGATGA